MYAGTFLANEMVSVSLKDNGRELPEQLEVHDATGRLVMRMNTSEMSQGSRISLPVKELANGSYQLTLITAKARYTCAFVVAH